MSYKYITANLPRENSDKQVVHKFLNKSSITETLKKSTQIFVDAIEDFCECSSGFQLVSVVGMYCNINKYAPLRGAAYIELPQYFKNKKCLINVKNTDNRCFAYSIASANNYDSNKDNSRASNYTTEVDKIEVIFKNNKINFPIKVSDSIYKKIEKILNISLNVYTFSLTKKKKQFVSIIDTQYL
jgi:hypothetical protein